MGGLAEPVLRRAARLGDGYIGWENPRCMLADVPSLLRRLHGYREDYGRASLPFELKFMPASASYETLARLRDAGVTDLILLPWLDTAGPDAPLAARLDAIKRFSDTLMHRLR